jgi:hypothetical protein
VALQALIAVVRFVASVVVLLLIAKVPAVALEQAFVPSDPAVGDPQEKLAVPEVPPLKMMSVPGVTVVTVTLLVLEEAVAPTAG